MIEGESSVTTFLTAQMIWLIHLILLIGGVYLDCEVVKLLYALQDGRIHPIEFVERNKGNESSYALALGLSILIPLFDFKYGMCSSVALLIYAGFYIRCKGGFRVFNGMTNTHRAIKTMFCHFFLSIGLILVDITLFIFTTIQDR